jgi:hypothetical protein
MVYIYCIDIRLDLDNDMDLVHIHGFANYDIKYKSPTFKTWICAFHVDINYVILCFANMVLWR